MANQNVNRTLIISAQVFRSGKRSFVCKLETGEIVEAMALAKQLKNNAQVVVGDYVELNFDDHLNEYHIKKVLPRKSEIFRMSLREGKRKVTAANCDILVIVVAASLPEYKRGIVDRFLVRASQWNLQPILVFNKIDQYNNEQDFDILFEEKRLSELGVLCFEVSAIKPDLSPSFLHRGMSDLSAFLKNKTAVFLGQSGVGKSALITSLVKEDVVLLSSSLSAVNKGAHTTTWAEMVDCREFKMVDSPGIRSFNIDDIFKEDLPSYFPDLLPYFNRCKFVSCTHADDAVGCFFQSLDADSDDDLAILTRLESFLRILEEVSQIPTWKKSNNKR